MDVELSCVLYLNSLQGFIEKEIKLNDVIYIVYYKFRDYKVIGDRLELKMVGNYL